MFRKENLYIFFLIITSYVIISFLPNFFPTLDVDSQSYIDNSPTRTSLYPLIIDLFYDEGSKNFYKLIIFQKIFFIISIFSLILSLKNSYLTVPSLFTFYFLIFFNIYYVSFCETVLTESLFFSFINFTVSFLLRNKSKSDFCYLGLVLGGLIAIKSVGIVLATLFFCITFFSIKKKFFLLLTIPTILILPMIEYYSYFFVNQNDKRQSVLEYSIKGKIFSISGSNNFDIKKIPERYRNSISKIALRSKEVNDFLKEISNPFLYSDLFADYEVYGQYQLKDEFKDIENELKDIFFQLIKDYPVEYLRISFWHYFGLWSPGGKKIFLKDFINDNQNLNLPLSSELIMTSGSMLKMSEVLLKISLIFFIGLFFIFQIKTIESIFNLIKRRANIFDFFTISCQIYLIVIALVNIATPRYLMPIYPLIIFIILFRFEKLKNKN